jgi:hypothetical protein
MVKRAVEREGSCKRSSADTGTRSVKSRLQWYSRSSRSVARDGESQVRVVKMMISTDGPENGTCAASGGW